MAQIKPLFDEFGVIIEAQKLLPNDKLKLSFIESLAELENNECHAKQQFPKTRLHKIKGIRQNIYRADVDKISGWHIHVQYTAGQLHLKDIIPGQKHDDVQGAVQAKRNRYT